MIRFSSCSRKKRGLTRQLYSLFVTSLIACLLTSVASAEPEYIYGIHDPGGEHLMGANKGWIVWTEAIGTSGNGGKNYTSWQNAGYGVIVRLNNGYGSGGTLPVESQYDAFAARSANFVQNSSGVDYWIIANETNLAREWPGNNHGDPNTGEPITATRYVKAYKKCYTAIKNVAPNAKLCPSPVGTWAPPYPAVGIDGFVDYWVNTLNGIGADKIDGLILHAYTHGADPALVTSEQKMGPPYQDIYYHFRVYKNLMWAIPNNMKDKPCLITECDQNTESADNASPKHAWLNQKNGWMKAVYAEIDDWNQNNDQPIRCVAMFRWPTAPEGAYTFGFSDLYNVQADFQDAVVYGYKWTTGNTNPPSTDIPDGDNLAVDAAYYIESGRNDTDQYGQSALDGNVNTKWCANTSQTNGIATLAVDLGNQATVNGFVVRHAETGGEGAHTNTKVFRVESAPSMHGPWTTEWSANNGAQAELSAFEYSSAKTLRYVRLVITNPGSDTYLRIPEFEVYGSANSAEAITIEAEDFDGGVNAANGTDYYDTSSGNSGGQYRSTDVDIENCTDGRYDVGWTGSDEWLNYPIQGNGSDYAVSLRYASPTGQGACRIKLDGVDVTGSIPMTSTGGWQNWVTLDCGDVAVGAGWHTLSFVSESSGYNFASIKLDPTDGSTPPPAIVLSEGNPSGGNVATSGSATTSSSYSGGSTGAEAIDGLIDAGNKWTSANVSGPHWLVVDLGSVKTVNGYKVHHAQAGGEQAFYNTQQFQIQVSSSQSGPWITHAEVDNSDQADAITSLSYNNPQQIRYVRLYITDPGVDNHVRLPEFEVYAQGGSTPPTGNTVAEDFNTMPSWSSSYNGSWGSAASWAISGNQLQGSRNSEGSSVKVKVYDIDANTDYTLSVWIKCPSFGGSYWCETAYRLGNYSASDFDANASSWSMVKKFDNGGSNGNSDTLTKYQVTFNSGSNTKLSIGYKLGSSNGSGPTVMWDTLRVE
ncbi:discoidin domain-containing protein [Planctomycetota bacterium]|nr:discoidin domain-containing protein [Planctomycetota bacterium]